MAAADLSEPEVLAHTKRRLFPEGDTTDTYAVVDTQFARVEWRPGQLVDERVGERASAQRATRRIGTGEACIRRFLAGQAV